jgi:hypothetical protein
MNKLTTVFYATVLTIGYSAIASAHTITGALGAGTSNEPAVDIYRANCFNDGTGNGARMRVSYTGSGTNIHRVSIVRQNPTTVGMTSVTSETNAAQTSNNITRNGTNGDFYLMVSRTTNSTTASTYTLNYHCETAGGVHTGTTDELDIVDPALGYFIQDQ